MLKIFLVSLFLVFYAVPDQSYGLNLPPIRPHGYGVPKITDALEKASERRRQEKRAEKQYQRQLELQKQISNQNKEALIIDVIVDKASKGKMIEKDKRYLEQSMGYESATIIWEFNESNK